MKKHKVISADEAVKFIKDGDTFLTGGFVGSSFPEELAIALEKRYLETGSPKNLTYVCTASLGNHSMEMGGSRLGHDGMLKRIIGSHFAAFPRITNLILDNKIEAYNFPLGTISHLYRDIAAHKPGTITKVGLHTFIDPRIQGGKLNEKTTEDLVELINIHGEDYLLYPSFPINVALIRGTTADEEGYITMEKESLILDTLAMAQAVKNSGGIVIAEVERVTTKHRLSPQLVQIPGILVDYIVVTKPENRFQSYASKYDPSFTGEIEVPTSMIPKMKLDERKIVARRATMFLRPDVVVNLGIGMPEGVASVANEENFLDCITLTVEPGAIGGIPQGGFNFGAAANPKAIISLPEQFDFYDGGGLDQTYLGMTEVDEEGNTNVSVFGKKIAGAGGFINITQNTKEIHFVGTFNLKAKMEIKDKQLKIVEEGKGRKFVKKVKSITFSGKYAASLGQKVFYITERAVFRLTSDAHVELIEVAPGIDVEKDVLAHMDFKPLISKDLKIMDSRIFDESLMKLREEKLANYDA